MNRNLTTNPGRVNLNGWFVHRMIPSGVLLYAKRKAQIHGHLLKVYNQHCYTYKRDYAQQIVLFHITL